MVSGLYQKENQYIYTALSKTIHVISHSVFTPLAVMMSQPDPIVSDGAVLNSTAPSIHSSFNHAGSPNISERGRSQPRVEYHTSPNPPNIVTKYNYKIFVKLINTFLAALSSSRSLVVCLLVCLLVTRGL